MIAFGQLLEWRRLLQSLFFIICFFLIILKLKECFSQYFASVRKVKRKLPLMTPSHKDYNNTLTKADELKNEGNSFLADNKLNQAYEKYTDAINLNLQTDKNAIYYANRAFVSLKLENIGSALDGMTFINVLDANKAIKINPEYIKGYYRRASANLLLFHYDDALEDFYLLLKHLPNDADLLDKIDKTKKQKRRKLFLESINESREQTTKNQCKIQEVLNKTHIKENTKMPYLSDISKISPSFIENMIEEMKSNNFLQKKTLLEVILQVKTFYDKQLSLINLTVQEGKEFTVCGDIHGQFYDLLNIFEINGYPTENNPYLFNGDFVDRGSFSVECVVTLLCYKVLYPNHFHLSRGNHEARNLNKLYGFENEVKAKYDSEVYDCFCELFCSLPLGHIINNKILVVHGGLFSQDGITLDQLKQVDRFQEPPEKGLMCEILWSDPSKLYGRQPSKRGIGVSFGPNVTKNFLEYNSLDLIIRSHEVKNEGYEIEHNGKLITVFSAPNYCDQMGNKGAIIRITGSTLKRKYIQFTAVAHPNVPAMNYATPWMFF